MESLSPLTPRQKPPENQAPKTLETLPPELLVEIFTHLHSFSDMVSWGKVCKKFRKIFLEARNWEHSESFEKLVHDSQNVTLKNQFWIVLSSFGHGSTLNFSRELATLFFNDANDDVLLSWMSSAGKRYKSFIDLLIPEKLNRKSIKSWAPFSNERQYAPEQIILPLRMLQNLDLSGTQDLNDEALIGIGNLKSLERLVMAAPITEKTLGLICSLPELKALSLDNCFKIKPGEFKALQALKKLTSFVLQRHRTVKNEDLQFLKELSSLESVQIVGCRGISSELKEQLGSKIRVDIS
jgi:hypothetical protein